MSLIELSDKDECRHLTRRQWRVAAYVILLIVGTGYLFKAMHDSSLAAREKINVHAR